MKKLTLEDFEEIEAETQNILDIQPRQLYLFPNLYGRTDKEILAEVESTYKEIYGN